MSNKIKLTMKLSHLYRIIHGETPTPPAPPREMNKEVIQRIISNKILEGKPLMVARFGSIECDVCENIRYTFYKKRSNWKFICWKGQPNFINPYNTPLFSKNAGFFPSNNNNALKKFYELMIDCMPDVDILQSWCHNERFFSEELRSCFDFIR